MISLCKTCYCMTHTVGNRCGKCGAVKEEEKMNNELRLSDKEKQVLEYLEKENKSVPLKTLREQLGENVVGTVGKLKQVGLVDLVKNRDISDKALRKQVVLIKEDKKIG